MFNFFFTEQWLSKKWVSMSFKWLVHAKLLLGGSGNEL